MRIAVVGGGPGGLYFAILMRRVAPDWEITVLERNRPREAFGFGVVFSDETLTVFEHADPQSYAAITERFVRWSDIDIHHRGNKITSGGHGFSALGRRELLAILQERALAVGVDLRFQHEVADLGALDADLIVGADGASSAVRGALASEFEPSVERRRCRYMWLGTDLVYEAFKFFIVETPHGVFQAHAYPYDDTMSTFIVETDEEVWRRAGLQQIAAVDLAPGVSDTASIEFCASLFADALEGHELLANNSKWINFHTVRNRRWCVEGSLGSGVGGSLRAGADRSLPAGAEGSPGAVVEGSPGAVAEGSPVVLLGDAAHTAHFSIGSGTKLAMEDAVALAWAFRSHGDDIAAATAAYEAERRPLVQSTQRAAQASLEWFEGLGRYVNQRPLQFAFNLLTRSRRVTYENLRERDPGFVDRVDREFAQASGFAPRPPMFMPFQLGSLTLANRVVVSAMDMYSARDGMPSDFHLVHLGSRAMGGAGLMLTEMICVSAPGRITPGCTGLYTAEHAAAWERIVAFVHAHSGCAIAAQIGHSGRKGSTKLMWEGIDEPLPNGNWQLIAPSPIPYSPRNQVPREMTRHDMDAVREQFVAAARAADHAGFDLLELHCAHGYLLSSFLSPLTNHRRDEYGGPLANRARYPLEVLDACRAVWPTGKPVSVRISATDWVPGGFDPDQAVAFARMLADHGVDVVDVSAGQVSPLEKPAFGRSFQTPFADRIRNEVGIATIAVGAISSYDDVNTTVLAGRADLCALARPHLYDPNWTLHAAAEQEYVDVEWALQYAAGSRKPPAGRGDGLRKELQRTFDQAGEPVGVEASRPG